MNINMIFDCKSIAYFTSREAAMVLFKYHIDT